MLSDLTPHPILINGEWIRTDPVHDNLNPSDTREVVSRQCLADAARVEQAVEAAGRARRAWAATTPHQRCEILERAGAEIQARQEELGRLLAREEGKTLSEAIGEVQRAAHILKFHAYQALHPGGEWLASTRPGVEVSVTREPVGVVGVITPWNFPIAIPAWKIAPALAHGNTVVFKPAELVPASAWALVDALHRAGLPPGVLNLVPGPGAQVGQALLDHPGVQALSFTGSVGTGRRVAAACSARLARFQLEMGGKNPLVVLDDADMEVALDCAIQGAYFSTGQRCTASSRLIVTPGIHDRFRDALVERVAALRVGHALDPRTQIGPVVDELQLAQDLRYIALGQEEGARLAVGGQRLKRDTPGHFLSPALFVEADARMRISREEIFGPVAVLIRAESEAHALELANDSAFGLSAGVCTSSLRSARRFQHGLQAGMVMVNTPTAGVDFHVPFGGTKGSSHGAREQGAQAREFYTQLKTTYLRP